jgi:8-hydroxy-5-deazaflavin:NADPH oxidoreductase
MHIGIIGVGNIGGNCARLLGAAGHNLTLSYSRNEQRLAEIASELGPHVHVGAVDEAARADLVIVAVPWDSLDEISAAAGDFDGRVVVDTTNQFSRSSGGVVDLGKRTAARVNADRLKGARYTKTFNTLTSGFQAETAGRVGDQRVVQWIAADDIEAADVVAALIDEIGYAPLHLAGIDGCHAMEAPRRPGAVYGEEYRLPDAIAVRDAVRTSSAIAPTPRYE